MSFTLLWRVGSVLNLPLAGFIKKLKARYRLFTLHHQQENWSSTMLGSVFLYPKFIHSFNALQDIVRGRSFMVWPMAQNNTRRGGVSKKILRMLYFVSFYYLQVKKNKDFLGHRICTSQPKHLRSHHTIIPAGLHSQPLFLWRVPAEVLFSAPVTCTPCVCKLSACSQLENCPLTFHQIVWVRWWPAKKQ